MRIDYKIHLNEEETPDGRKHVYTVNGVVKQSVTQTLKGAGIVDDYSDIDPYYALRGIAVHAGCTLLAQGFLGWSTVADDVLPFIKTFERLSGELGLEYVSAEEPCYDIFYDICGKYDLIMMWRGKRTLVELKTGPFPMWGGLQTASYEKMTEVEDVMGISLKDKGKVYVKGKDYHKNHEVLNSIHNGTFNLAEWKSNRNRRYMDVLKVAA